MITSKTSFKELHFPFLNLIMRYERLCLINLKTGGSKSCLICVNLQSFLSRFFTISFLEHYKFQKIRNDLSIRSAHLGF